MEIIEVRTLIDITQTKVTRLTQGSQLELDQHRNFTTLNQCIELRSVVNYDQGPTCEKVDIKGMGFGTNYKGQHNVWTFKFSPDRSGVYKDEQANSIGFLIEDLHAVPVIKNLSETINIDKAIFNIKDSKTANTIITALPNTI
jgi:hypothetical protein